LGLIIGLQRGKLNLVALSIDYAKFRIKSTLLLLRNQIELPHFTRQPPPNLGN